MFKYPEIKPMNKKVIVFKKLPFKFILILLKKLANTKNSFEKVKSLQKSLK